jgi:[lysine-biosynthesis-protein LysW]--L-2-aminoadipate ligase
MVELCIIYDKVRFEEKALYDKALKKGLKAQIVDAKTITINTESNRKDFRLGDVVLQRSISHYRGLYLTIYQLLKHILHLAQNLRWK